jgi:hypothetical protein
MMVFISRGNRVRFGITLTIFLLVIMVLGAGVKKATVGTGTVMGTCSLPDSSNWSGITVIIAGRNESTTTDGAGDYVLNSVPAGALRIQAGKIFYANAVQDTFLAANETLHVNLALSSFIADTFAGQATPAFTSGTTNVGNLGVPNRFIVPGDSGFTWSGQQQLKEGSLMIGAGTGQVSDAARFIFGLAQDNLDQDFQSRSDVVVLTSGMDSTVHFTAFDDSRANVPPGNPSQPMNILVTQTTSSFGAAGDDAYLLIGLKIKNTGYLPVNNLLVGWFVDWNVGGSGTTNRGGVVFANQQIAGLNNGFPFPVEIAYQRRSTTTGPFMGIVPLSQAQFRASRIASIQNEIVPSSPNGGLTEANKYIYMRDRRGTNKYSDRGVEEDLCTIASVGGTQTDNYSSSYIALAPGGTIQVGFAFVGGSDSLNLIQNALNAQKKWIRQGNAMDVIPTTWQVNARWNMISIPVFVQDSSKLGLFPSASSSAFSYIPNHGYAIRDTLGTGIGYWLKFPSQQVVNLSGVIRRIDTINVAQGWNMIGALSFPIAITAITTVPPGLVQSGYFGFNGSYQTTDTLQPMQGYWVKASQTGQIILNAPHPTISPKPSH